MTAAEGSSAGPAEAGKARPALHAAAAWLEGEGSRGLVTVGIFAVALLVRLWFSLGLHHPAGFVTSDMWVYDLRAQHLRSGELGPWDSFTPVGYPAILALLYAMSGKSLGLVAVVQSVMGAATASLSYLITRRILGSGILALAVGVLVTAHLPLVLYGGFLLSEVPFAFFLILSTWLLLRAADRPGWSRSILAGLALGAATVVRPNLLIFFPLLPLWAWAATRSASGRRVRRDGEAITPAGGEGGLLTRAARDGCLAQGIPLVAGALLGALPLLLAASAHNSRLLGHPAGLGSNGGLNFFLAHSEVRGALYREGGARHEIVPIPNMVRYDETYVSPVPFYEESHFYREGLRQLADDPLRLIASLRNVVEGAGLGVQNYWPGWSGREILLRTYSRAFFFWGILPGMAWLLWLLARGRLLLPEHGSKLLLALLLASTLATLYLFLGDPRMRVPFDPLLIILSIGAIASAVGWARRRLATSTPR